MYTIKSGDHQVILTEEELPFVSDAFQSIFEADTTVTVLEIKGGQQMIQLITKIRDGDIKREDVPITSMTLKWMLTPAASSGDRLYRNAVKSTMPIYHSIREAENAARRIYAKEILTEEPPILIVDHERFDEYMNHCRGEVTPYRNLSILNKGKCYNADTSVRAHGMGMIVGSIYRSYRIHDIFRIPSVNNAFCIAGDAVIACIMGAQQVPIAVDLYPMTRGGGVKRAIGDMHSHLSNTMRNVSISRGKRAISIRYNNTLIPDQSREVADAISQAALFTDPEGLLNMLRIAIDQEDSTSVHEMLRIPPTKREGFMKAFKKMNESVGGGALDILFDPQYQYDASYTTIRISLQSSRSLSETMCRFAVDCQAFAIYQDRLYGTMRSLYALANETNVIDPTRQTRGYIELLRRCKKIGFNTHVPGINEHSTVVTSAHNTHCPTIHGLKRLLSMTMTIVEPEYDGPMVRVHSINTLFNRVQEDEVHRYLFSRELLYSDYLVEMAGSDNRCNREFYNVDGIIDKRVRTTIIM